MAYDHNDPRYVKEVVEETPIDKQILSSITMNNFANLYVGLNRVGSEEEYVEYLNTHILNEDTGNKYYHLAALTGKSEIIDHILNLPCFENDPLNHAHETPLHSIVYWVNNSRENWNAGFKIVEMMLDAGSDNRIRNNQGKTAADLVKEHKALKELLTTHKYTEYDEDNNPIKAAPEPEKVEMSLFDEVPEDDHDDDDEGGVYSGSDEEFDPEEFKRHQEGLKAKAAKGSF